MSHFWTAIYEKHPAALTTEMFNHSVKQFSL